MQCFEDVWIQPAVNRLPRGFTNQQYNAQYNGFYSPAPYSPFAFNVPTAQYNNLGKGFSGTTNNLGQGFSGSFNSLGNQYGQTPVIRQNRNPEPFEISSLQVWSQTQFNSADFSKSRQTNAFSTNAQSRFASVVVDGVLVSL